MKEKRWIAAVLLVLVLGAAVAGKRGLQGGEVTSFVPEFEEGQTQETEESHTEKGIKVPGYTVIPVNAGKTDVSIDLFNPEENEVYFQISFLLPEEEEPIFQSKLIRPGDHLYQIELLKPLEAGSYDLTIQYDTFAMDEKFSPRNGASVNCVLEAK